MTTNKERAKMEVCALLDKVQPPEYSYGPCRGHRKHGSWVVFKNAEQVMTMLNAHEPFAQELDDAEARSRKRTIEDCITALDGTSRDVEHDHIWERCRYILRDLLNKENK